jgi:single-stranded-DNA-specific exonuclease
MLPQGQTPDAIVLADENWHQGVVGIVSSRIAEEYCCPTFLICLDGDHGKASSRSYGGFNLFAALTQLSSLLESYGGHELAAGFTIHRDNIPKFREEIGKLARKYYSDGMLRTVLEADCVVRPELLTVGNIESLSQLEPCGNGCPKPILVMEGLTVDRIAAVGNGRHLRMRFTDSRNNLQGIWFSVNPETAAICSGDLVDVAFIPQVNEFRGERVVQLNVQDIRPHCKAECSMETGLYRTLCDGSIAPAAAAKLLPDRAVLGMVWKYLTSVPEGIVREDPACLCRKIVRWTGLPMELGTLLVCLDIFSDVGLVNIRRYHKYITIQPAAGSQKADLAQSRTMQRLMAAKEECHGKF